MASSSGTSWLMHGRRRRRQPLHAESWGETKTQLVLRCLQAQQDLVPLRSFRRVAVTGGLGVVGVAGVAVVAVSSSMTCSIMRNEVVLAMLACAVYEAMSEGRRFHHLLGLGFANRRCRSASKMNAVSWLRCVPWSLAHRPQFSSAATAE